MHNDCLLLKHINMVCLEQNTMRVYLCLKKGNLSESENERENKKKEYLYA